MGTSIDRPITMGWKEDVTIPEFLRIIKNDRPKQLLLTAHILLAVAEQQVGPSHRKIATEMVLPFLERGSYPPDEEFNQVLSEHDYKPGDEGRCQFEHDFYYIVHKALGYM